MAGTKDFTGIWKGEEYHMPVGINGGISIRSHKEGAGMDDGRTRHYASLQEAVAAVFGNGARIVQAERAFIMASRSSNRAEVPEAKEALDRFKMEVAQELGVPLSNGYNGNLTSAQNGSVGGYMVKKMIEAQEKQMAGK